MKNRKNNRTLRAAALTLALLAAGLMNVAAQTKQRSQTVAEQSNTTSTQNVKAKYDGGVFGFYQKTTGTLSYDDANRRLVFKSKKGQELLAISYDAILGAATNVTSKTPFWVGAASIIPYGAGTPAQFLIKTKSRYLMVQYREPDTETFGVASFKMKNAGQIAAFQKMLAAKTGLVQRGNFYARRKNDASPATAATVTATIPR